MNDNYVEINLDNIAFNVKNILKTYNNYKYYIGVVKGNAYGHGYEVANTIIENGFNYLAVSDITEARALKKVLKFDIPILIMTPTNIEFIDECIKNNFTIVLSNWEYYKELKKLNKKITAHLILNTGMNRLGFNNKSQIEEIYNDCLINKNNIILEGIFTHMATLGIVDTNWDKQLQTFQYLTKDIDLKKFEIVDIAGSSSLVVHPKIEFCNGVRVGSLLYGVAVNHINEEGFINKLKKVKRNYIRKKYNISKINNDFSIELKQSLTYYSKVIELRQVAQGNFIGYNASYKTNCDIIVATIPVGYANGMPFDNNNRKVCINNNCYPIIGSTNMNIITVKVDKNVKLHDKVVLLSDMENTKKISTDLNMSPIYLFEMIPSNIQRIYTKK